jgi:hypothetical protein
MAVPQGDLARVKSQEPNQNWPDLVEIRVGWNKPNGRVIYRSETITADAFFGAGGAPLAGDRLVAMIERMRKQGAPKARKR